MFDVCVRTFHSHGVCSLQQTIGMRTKGPCMQCSMHGTFMHMHPSIRMHIYIFTPFRLFEMTAADIMLKACRTMCIVRDAIMAFNGYFVLCRTWFMYIASNSNRIRIQPSACIFDLTPIPVFEMNAADIMLKACRTMCIVRGAIIAFNGYLFCVVHAASIRPQVYIYWRQLHYLKWTQPTLCSKHGEVL